MIRRGFLSDMSALVSGQMLVSVLALATSVVVARALGAEGRGHFALALLLPTLLTTFTDFGVGTTGPRFVASRRWPAGDILATHLLAGGVRIVGVAVVGLTLVLVAGDRLFPGVPTGYLVIGQLQLLPTTVAGFILTLLLGLGLAAPYSRLLLLGSLLSFVAICTVWWVKGDVGLALLLEIGAGWLSALLTWKVVRAAIGKVGAAKADYFREAWRFGFGVYVSNVTLFANARIVWLLINATAGAAGVGVYTVAQSASERIYLIADAMGTLLLPRVAENPAENSAQFTPIVFRIAVVVSIGAAIVIALLADWLIPLLFSSAFEASIPLLRSLLVAVVLSSGWRVLFQDLNARGKSMQTASVNGAATVAGLALAAVLLPRVGLQGAAWSAIGSSALSLVLGVWLFNRYRGNSLGARGLVIISTREIDLATRFLRWAARGRKRL